MNLSHIIYGVFLKPKETFGYLCIDRKKWSWGLSVFIMVILLQSILNQAMDTKAWLELPPSVYGFYWISRAVMAVAVLLFATGFISLLAELLYKRGNGLGLLTVICFSTLPACLGTAIGYAFFLLNVPVVGNLLMILTFIWVFVLQIMAIKTVFVLDTAHAVTLFFSPALIVVIGLIIILIVGVVFSGIF